MLLKELVTYQFKRTLQVTNPCNVWKCNIIILYEYNDKFVD